MVRGTARNAGPKFKMPMAGKTGTSQNSRDAWFVGLTPQIAIGVWVGRDDDKSLGDGVTGGYVSANVAVSVMNAAVDAGLITEGGFLPNEYIIAHASWPPALLSPEGNTSFPTSEVMMTYGLGTQDVVVESGPSQAQVDAYLEQINRQFSGSSY